MLGKIREAAGSVVLIGMTIGLIIGVLSWLASTAEARGCHKQAVAIQKVVAQKVVAHPVCHQAVVERVVQQHHYQPPVQNYFYGVGQPLVQQAMVTQGLRELASEYRFEAQITGSVQGGGQAITGGYAAPQAAAPAATPAAPQFNFTAPGTGQATGTHCAQCHTGDTAKGGFDIETANVDQVRSAYRRMREGTMPPSGPLSAEQQLQAMDEYMGKR